MVAGSFKSSHVRTAAKLLLAIIFVGAGFQWGGRLTHTPVADAASPQRTAPAIRKAPAAQTKASPAIDPAFVVKRVLKIDSPFRHGDYVWNDTAVPAGPIVITVDLAAQTLSIFRDGYEIGAAVILYGADNLPTPLGTFPIMEKDADHVSNLYDAPMPYMLRLTRDGVAIHGSEVKWGGATHGCIGVPTKFAKLLFGQAKVGDQVIITNGKMLDLDKTVPAT
jgi:lipoprotein-anchoring transpeptidase ErfK/SrfK